MGNIENRKQYIGVLSVLSAFSVVLLHADGCFWTFSYERYWLTANIIDSVFYFAVPVFFMITGSNLLDYRDRYDTKTYFSKRCKRTLVPFLVWSIFGLCVLLAFGKVSFSDLSLSYIITGVLNTDFISIYWFFIPLFAVYLAIPFLSYIPKEYRKTCFSYGIAAIFIFSQLLPFICSLIEGVDYNSALNFPLGGYLFYILCGYYIDNYSIEKKTRYIIYVAGLIGLIIHIVGTWAVSYEAGEVLRTFKGYLNVPSVLYSVAVFVAFKYMDKTKIMNVLSKICGPFEDVTLGIYLMHWFILQLFKQFSFVDPRSIIYRIGGGILAFMIAAGVSKVFKKIPVLRRLC